MTETDAMFRDLWRVGLLLTGSEAGATASAMRVMRAHENVLRVSEDRRRKLVVIGAREWAERHPSEASPEVSGLIGSSRRGGWEAWVLREVVGWSEVEVARATGVARSALSPCVAETGRRIAEAGRSAAWLRAWADAADAESGVARARALARSAARRRRLVGAAQVVALMLVFSLLGWIGVDLMRANQRERERRALEEAVSNPMPAEAARAQQRERRRAPASAAGPTGGTP